MSVLEFVEYDIMTQTAKEMISAWKQSRYQEIRKLYNGKNRRELEKRFGAQNVSNALDKTFRYQ